MSTDRSKRIQEILSRALECPVEDRAALLFRECGDDADLRREVEKLLAASERAEAKGFLSDTDPLTGTAIGPYRIQRCLGQGGMGAVYLAEQLQPIHRQVALKIIKLGMDTRQVMARFEAEREALSLMNHPNVARVLDAGATERGRPYFVMEYIEGMPITSYCDLHRLSTKERIRLFMDVCAAVQHAHQKATIHRDIKPSNVLVAEVDGKPVPKVIDFGIAKAIQQQESEATYFTETGQLIGTPGYMSPEQAGGNPADIDTRTDVYSLGVLLYELLVGARPFDDAELRRAGFAEIQRIIREIDPPKPSTRLSSLGESSATVASRRKTSLGGLSKELRGDLDWIVMRCLEKDRSRRYETVNALAIEIQRHLNNEPVLAGPPSAVYRIRKFVRRNKAPVAAIVAVIVVLTAGLAGTSYGLTQAVRERKRAEAQEAEARKTRIDAEQRTKELEKVARFQASQLSEIDVEHMGVRLRRKIIEKRRSVLEARGADGGYTETAVRELESGLEGVNFTNLGLETLDENIFERAIVAIEKDFGDQPLLKARLLQTIATSLNALGLPDRAIAPQTKALDIRRQLLGDDHPDTLTSNNEMGNLLKSRGRIAEAEPYLRDSIENCRRVLGAEHPDTIAAINNLAALLQLQNKLGEAEAALRDSLEISGRALGNEHPHTLSAITNLGVVLQEQGSFAEAEQYARSAIDACRRALGDDHPRTLTAINNLGVLLSISGKREESERLHRRALDARRRVLGDEHPDTLISVSNLAAVLVDQNRLGEAESYHHEALTVRRRTLGNDHPSTLTSVHAMGVLLQKQKKLAEAEPYLREVLEARRRVLGETHQKTLISILSIGALLRAQGKSEEAIHILSQAEQSMRKAFTGDNVVSLGIFLAVLGCTRTTTGNLDMAEVNLREAEEILQRSPGTSSKQRKDVLACLVQLYEARAATDPGAGFDSKAAEWAG